MICEDSRAHPRGHAFDAEKSLQVVRKMPRKFWYESCGGVISLSLRAASTSVEAP